MRAGEHLASRTQAEAAVCNLLQSNAVYCSILQSIAAYCSLGWAAWVPQRPKGWRAPSGVHSCVEGAPRNVPKQWAKVRRQVEAASSNGPESEKRPSAAFEELRSGDFSAAFEAESQYCAMGQCQSKLKSRILDWSGARLRGQREMMASLIG